MIKPRLILCSDVEIAEDDPRREGRHILQLDSLGENANINLRVEDVAKVFLEHLPSRLVDFLEIAAYIYAADCATDRGEAWFDEGPTEPWSRDFYFVIPVRDLDFWRRDDVQLLLKNIVEFLSNDKCIFSFQKLSHERPLQEYLDFREEEDWPFYGVDRVVMFSGGLDSLAGAVETAADGRNVVLVSHRTVSTINARQRALYAKLNDLYPKQVIHIPVWVNKTSSLGREHTQRTRSLMFCALGTTVAESVRAGGVRFFENGIVSLNLPVADEVLRARASRTTHPHVLDMLSRFCQLIVGREFVVDNPYLMNTKTEVVQALCKKGGGPLIGHTCSCAHTAFKSKNQWHCGTCSQCIDRRIAVLGAGEEANDPETDYVSDVFTGSRKEGYEKNMAVDYAHHGLELAIDVEERQ